MVLAMPTYLQQIVAVQRGVEADTKTALDEVKRILAVGGDQDPLTGPIRIHEPRGDDDVKQPDQRRRVQITQ